MDAAIPADAQNAPTGIWKSRTEREIPTAPPPIIVVVNERKNNGDSNSVAKPSTESDQAQSHVLRLEEEVRASGRERAPAARVGQKGIHAEMYRAEMRRCLLRTILLLDDVVALKQEVFQIRHPIDAMGDPGLV